MIKLMKKAGLSMLLIGFESGNHRILTFLRKGIKVQTNYDAANICKKYGIRIWANYMLGIPTETKEEAMDTVRMIQGIGPYTCSPAFYTPHPGSDLYDYCIKNNISLIKTHSDYRRDPSGAKIKGIDYDFLRSALKESMNQPLSVRLERRKDKVLMKMRKFFNKKISLL